MPVPYPSDSVPSAVKRSPAWIARTGWALYSETETRPALNAYLPQSISGDVKDGTSAVSTLTVDQLRAYAEGRQDATKYVRWLSLPRKRAQANLQKARLNVDRSILSAIPFFRNAVRGRLQKIRWEVNLKSSIRPTPTAANPTADPQQGPGGAPDPMLTPPAAMRRHEAKGQALAVMSQAPFLQQQGQNPVEYMPPELQAVGRLPVDEAELDRLLEKMVPDPVANRLQAAVNQQLYKAHQRQVVTELCDDIYDLHQGFLYVPMDGAATATYVRPDDMRIPKSKKRHFSDVTVMGHMEEVSLGKLREEAERFGASIPEDVWVQVATKAGWAYGSETMHVEGVGGKLPTGRSYDGILVPVFRFAFRSYETAVQRRQTSSKGNLIVTSPKGGDAYLSKENRKGEAVTAPISWVYVGSILTTGPLNPQPGDKLAPMPYHFGCRCPDNQVRDPLSPWDMPLPYVPIYLPGPSRLMQQIAPADNLQRCWLRYQEDLMRALPAGVHVDLAQVKSLFSMGGAKDANDAAAKVEEFVASVMQGNSVGDSTPNPDGLPGQQKSAAPPVTPMYFGLPPSIAGYRAEIASEIETLQRISGVNVVASGLNPENRVRMGKATSEIAVDAVDANLSDLIGAVQHGLQQAAERIMLRLAAQLGIPYAYTLTVKVGATDGMWDELYAQAKLAQQNNQVTLADVAYIQNTEDFDQAYEYLVSRITQREQEVQQQALAKEDANSKRLSAVATAAEGEKQKTRQIEGDQERQTEDVKGHWQVQVELLRLAVEHGPAAIEMAQKLGIGTQQLAQIGQLAQQQQQESAAEAAEPTQEPAAAEVAEPASAEVPV